MYNHLILNPQEDDLKIDHIEPIKNKIRLKDIAEDEYLKLRRHGLELILSGKGIVKNIFPLIRKSWSFASQWRRSNIIRV